MTPGLYANLPATDAAWVMRPGLYERLERRYGEVKVVHPGEPNVWDVRENAEGKKVRYVSTDAGHSRGEAYRICCPLCHERGFRLYINHAWGLPDPETGSLNLWLAKCYNETDCLSYGDHARVLYNEVFAPGERPDDVVRPANLQLALARGPRWRWPGTVVPLDRLVPDNHAARAYLRGRAFDPDWLSCHLGVGFLEAAADPDYQWLVGRIVIPVYHQGACVGWQARALGGGRKPKYYTADGMDRGSYLYNLDSAARFPTVIVQEGPTKVWRTGPEAVATLGQPSGQQLARLVQFEAIVLMLDPNARLASAAACARLRPHRPVLEICPPADPGDMTVAAVRGLVAETAARFAFALPGFRP